MKSEHLSWDLLVRALDQELSYEDRQWVTAHVADCPDCRRQYEEIENISFQVGSAVNTAAVAGSPRDPEQFAARLGHGAIRHAPEKVMRRFGWGMAIAATFALGIIIAPKQKTGINNSVTAEPSSLLASNAIEVDGETFVVLPYSNPDLSASAPRIVQMQVPVSSLTDIGITLEPVANQVSNLDRSVLADVLLGADGQPLGVHVVSWE
jgi:hypothetical protein